MKFPILTTALLIFAAIPVAMAQMPVTTTTTMGDGTVMTETRTVDPYNPPGKVVGDTQQVMTNPDGSTTTIRKVTTETDNPPYRPEGVPEDATGKTVTTVTTSTTVPAGQ